MTPRHPLEGEILYSADQILRGIEGLAKKLERQFGRGQEPVCLVGVMMGAFPFLCDLARALLTTGVPNVVTDHLFIESYVGTAPDGEPRIYRDLRMPITDRTVVLLEDIVDTGATLSCARAHLLAQHPRQLITCALLERRNANPNPPLDHRVFVIPSDAFVIGYGLDWNGQGREFDDISVINTDHARVMERFFSSPKEPASV